jgi:hypothetical protein
MPPSLAKAACSCLGHPGDIRHAGHGILGAVEFKFGDQAAPPSDTMRPGIGLSAVNNQAQTVSISSVAGPG